ncbi:MAG: hypothetical protein IJ258_11690 [Methanobrevibacter sp.]|uniref:hypothetical protein n=1 Tax=Methanobrevibacter sp. TaxID=66852 RepID=UPI0025F84738|nr:hypothetical protein [Methanobrevibacter sp.]MBQ8018741.1 hypothetical protein [Methanobrevibacter sp.]
MDNKGFISIEYLFSLFIIIIIALGVLFYASASISSSLNIEDSVTHRLILDDVANVISQVNSNGVGYSKYLKLPSDKGYFEVTVENNKLTMEYDDKKGETALMFANLDSKYRLVSGRSYVITKTDEGVVIT